LYDPAIIDIIGKDPHPFQTGYMMSMDAHRVLLAGTQCGKSRTALQDAITMLTGIVPHSMRVPAGVDTGVKRQINKENILRWGRRDLINGDLIDHNFKAKRDGSWDCGTIIGVGVYPSDKFCPPGKQVWIGSTAQALLKYWWPKFFPGKHMMVPQEYIDESKGNNGYDKTHGVVYFHGDRSLIFTSYESQYDKFEAEKAWACILDEEPPNEKILAAAATHAKFLSIVETPYRGITYSEEFIFNSDPDKRPRLFHCTAYDSPYRHPEDIETDRRVMKKWDLKARIWGLFSEVTGLPYYDREKLLKWYEEMQAKEKDVRYARMIPQKEYENIYDMVGIDVKIQEVDEVNEQDVWRIYELPRKGVAYVAGIDIAEGAENPNDAADRQACCITRKPLPGSGEKGPVVVASLRSTLLVSMFAHVAIHGCAYYNNALLAPESMRGYHNGAFMVEVNDYPYFFTMMTTNDVTRKPQTRKGFVTSPKSRETLFKLIERDIVNNEDYEPCPFRDIDLVKELMMAVVGKNGRCDHTRKGSLDTAVAYGITLYVVDVSPEQIICNKRKKRSRDDEPYGHIKWLIDGRPDDEIQGRRKGHLGMGI